ncbi:uncharacterized protein LOC123869737 [Maniola jurtina]|uniref:uncharacterized protein LOC123869737 n=1 Tax=Maniola jurtina TaxID=191418 RepID=UPI001E68E493|nr:uncharacterized protein LOC123869737 [Maniola jurtina]
MSKEHVKTKSGIPVVVDEPSISETSLLVTVEDLINRAMGSPDANIVDFKLVRLILEILAKQQRILLQKIEIRITEIQQEKTAADDSSEKSLSKSPPQAKSFEKMEKTAQVELKILLDREQEETNEYEMAEKISQRELSDASRIEITVEKAPSIHSETRSSSTIDFVTRSQFAFLEAAVDELKSMTPPKSLQFPGNEKLMSDMMKGAVSLPEAMNTLQVEERMKSAEKSVTRIVEILTQLVAAGVLPEDIAEQVETIIPPSYEEVKEEAIQSQPLVEKKSVALDAKATQSQTIRGLDSHPPITTEPSMVSRTSAVSGLPMASSTLKVPCITYEDMRVYLEDLKDDIKKIVNRMIGKVTEVTETAKHMNTAVADKLNVVQKLDSRISALRMLLEDGANQYSEFDSILTIQLRNIKDQIAQTLPILKDGIARLADANNYAEAKAIMNLLECSEEMSTELSNLLYEIKGLVLTQTEHRSQIRADLSTLVGTLSYEDFAAGRADFKGRLDHCHEIFNRSIALWAAVIRDMKTTMDKMVDLAELLTVRDSVQGQLQTLNNKIRIVTTMLGDPQIARTMRKLAVNATCGSCHEPARMEPVDATSGVPPRLPPLRPAPVAASKEPCISDLVRAWLPEPRSVFITSL